MTMLAALACVDAVLIFDEETPEQALRLLKPTSSSRAAITRWASERSLKS